MNIEVFEDDWNSLVFNKGARAKKRPKVLQMLHSYLMHQYKQGRLLLLKFCPLPECLCQMIYDYHQVEFEDTPFRLVIRHRFLSNAYAHVTSSKRGGFGENIGGMEIVPNMVTTISFEERPKTNELKCHILLRFTPEVGTHLACLKNNAVCACGCFRHPIDLQFKFHKKWKSLAETYELDAEDFDSVISDGTSITCSTTDYQWIIEEDEYNSQVQSLSFFLTYSGAAST